MAELRAEQFSDFFKAVHRLEPFPWQAKLAQKVFMDGWPSALDIPTGAGKTAAIDIAVFHLALEAGRSWERRAAVRILFVVDRRLIVDDAYERAQKIAEALSAPEQPILKGVAERLALLAEEDSNPLAVVRLRGGMPKEPDWVRTPGQPTIVVSTVDQVGSRLLFRGYGISDTMKPVHAGLIGVDSLILLDEAHLSQPFLQTARDTLGYRKPPWTENRAPAPFQIVSLSATLSPNDVASDPPFRISDQDRTHKRLSPRLMAVKPTELIEEKSEAAMEERLTNKAWEWSQRNGGAFPVIAVVVNRVRRARAIFDALVRRGAVPFDAESRERPAGVRAALLIGRVRALDRDELIERLLRYMHAFIPDDEHNTRPSLECPLIVVATQCIEAGADLDFDALASEIAPLDCLRQRFGRLNRMGRPIEAHAVIVACSEQLKKNAEDPIYGEALKNTWTLLAQKSKAVGRKKNARRIIDFGVATSDSWFPAGDGLLGCLAPKKNAPVLMPSAIRLWSRTSPIPFADPEISLYLHGPDSGPGDVEIVWRADLDDSIDYVDKERIWLELGRVCPPTSLESISVPLVEAKNWLRGIASANFGDTETSRVEDNERGNSQHEALCWVGVERSEVIRADQLRPGHMIVVPSTRGGCDWWGWNPASTDPVLDRGREANQTQCLRDILRLSGLEPEQKDQELVEEMRDWADAEIISHYRAKFVRDKYVGRPRVLRADNRRPLAIEWKLPRQTATSRGDATTEDDTSIGIAARRSVLLKEHSHGVETFARRFAEQAGLPTELLEDLALGGYLHDAGKAHPQFKRFLYNGDELAVSGPDLAKSARLPGNPSEWNNLRDRSGLPRRARHEIASLPFALAHSRLARAHDRDLVLWLVGTHHGYGRPFFPVPEREWPTEGDTFETDLGDGNFRALPAPSMAELTSPWCELSERVVKRYGAWGLARLEAILRLADHRESEREQNDPNAS